MPSCSGQRRDDLAETRLVPDPSFDELQAQMVLGDTLTKLGQLVTFHHTVKPYLRHNVNFGYTRFA
jgi:hypothetical protein